MTKEVYLGIAGLEHLTKQPFDKRYALFCRRPDGTSCDSQSRGNWIGDFSNFEEAKRVGELHPHPVFIRYYPDSDEAKPSQNFLNELENLPNDHRVW